MPKKSKAYLSTDRISLIPTFRAAWDPFWKVHWKYTVTTYTIDTVQKCSLQGWQVIHAKVGDTYIEFFVNQSFVNEEGAKEAA